jgi:DNA-binding ferritin-like protein
MIELSALLRTLQLYAHHAHHIVARIVFLQDHEILAEIYTKAESDYDDVIERIIGTRGEEGLDESKILLHVAQKIAKLPMKDVKENKEVLKVCLDLIQEINAKIEPLCKDPKTSQGTIQMIGNIADKNEVLVYKLKQRIK